MHQTSKKSGRFLTKAVPVFPGYMFFGSKSKNPSWTSINSTRGVTHAVTLDGKYRPILNEIVEELKNRCDKEGILDFGNKIEPGDQLRLNKVHLVILFAMLKILTLNNVHGF